MGFKDKAEACGRCAMTSVTAVTQETDDADDGPDLPFEGERIELDEDELRKASPHVVAMAKLKRRVNEVATRITYGR